MATRPIQVRTEQDKAQQRPAGQPTMEGKWTGSTSQSQPSRMRRVGNDYQQDSRAKRGQEEKLAQGLGWFSIGLGLAEILAPQGFAKMIGARGKNTSLIRAYGLREIVCGVGILSQRRPAEWVWARVGGDVMDLACLGASFAAPKTNPGRLAAATASVVGVTVLDVICARQLARQAGSITASGDVHVAKSVIIDRSPEELYQYWHNFRNLASFMNNLESVQDTGDRRSHWVAKGPAGTTVEWDAEITEDRPNELIAWQSVEGADVDNSGCVRFERMPGDRGTKVSVEMFYHPPAGVIGAGVAMLFGDDPEWQVKDDLRRFKQVMELGEIPVSDATIWGNGLSEQRPGQPRGRR